MNDLLYVLGGLGLVAAGYGIGVRSRNRPALSSSHPSTESVSSSDEGSAASLKSIVASQETFEHLHSKWSGLAEPWPIFCEFARSFLHGCCGARHVKLYRITEDGKELILLRDTDPLGATDRISARKGIVGHVVTCGEAYLAGDTDRGELVSAHDQDSDQRLAWCFAVELGGRRVGIVTAAEVAPAHDRKEVFRLAECMLGQFWRRVAEAQKICLLQRFDPVCELLSRPALLEAAETALNETYREGAPAAVAVLALEGLRGMNDSGRWEIADELLKEISATLRARLRNEDCVGRFDGSRFVLLLRRVDSELAALIVRQLLAQLEVLCGNHARWGATISIRCGLAGSGARQPKLRTLLSQALGYAHHAREQGRLLVSDLAEQPAGASA